MITEKRLWQHIYGLQHPFNQKGKFRTTMEQIQADERSLCFLLINSVLLIERDDPVLSFFFSFLINFFFFSGSQNSVTDFWASCFH